MLDAIIVGIVMFTAVAIVAIVKIKEYAVENRKLRIEERLKMDELTQKILELDTGAGSATAEELKALREEVSNLSRQVAELKEQIQLRGSSHL